MRQRNRIAVVGGAGYIGSALARYFMGTYNLRILDVTPLPKELEGMVEYRRVDVRNYEQLEEGLNGCDLAIHTAIIQIPRINEEKRLGYDVNIVGTHNICEAVEKTPPVKGMILASSWHTMGEKDVRGTVDERFGFRPDKVEERARLYALSKIAQESIVRYHDEMSEKIFSIIRMGTVLGEGMPKETAANIFVEKGLKGEAITPYKHSMHRPMLYVDIQDVCKVYESLARLIMNRQLSEETNSYDHIFNVYHPKPVTILELAEIIREIIIDATKGKVMPRVQIVDLGLKSPFNPHDNRNLKVNISKLSKLIDSADLLSPKDSLKRIIGTRISRF